MYVANDVPNLQKYKAPNLVLYIFVNFKELLLNSVH